MVLFNIILMVLKLTQRSNKMAKYIILLIPLVVMILGMTVTNKPQKIVQPHHQILVIK